jgi:hypothetical protein
MSRVSADSDCRERLVVVPHMSRSLYDMSRSLTSSLTGNTWRVLMNKTCRWWQEVFKLEETDGTSDAIVGVSSDGTEAGTSDEEESDDKPTHACFYCGSMASEVHWEKFDHRKSSDTWPLDLDATVSCCGRCKRALLETGAWPPDETGDRRTVITLT